MNVTKGRVRSVQNKVFAIDSRISFLIRELGDQIRNSVLDALSSGDFTGLSDSIARSVNVVIGDVGDQISRVAYTAANRFEVLLTT